MNNKSILTDNASLAVMFSDMIASTLGPNGLNKLLVDSTGDVYVTNDTKTIIDKVDVKHPIIKIIIKTAITQISETGDGAATVIIITGELLRQALDLIAKGVMIPVIINGYKKALKDSLEILKKNSFSDDNSLRNALVTALKRDDELIDALIKVKDTPIEDVIIMSKKGNGVELIKGLAIDKEPPHPVMPTRIEKPRIIITKTPIEVKSTDIKAEFKINNPSQLTDLMKRESNMVREITSSIKESRANLVICQKGISEDAQEQLARAGIMALRRVREKDIELLVKATGAKIISDLHEIKKEDFGSAGLIEVRKISDERLTVISECPKKVNTIIVKSSLKQGQDELENLAKKGLMIIKEAGVYVPGAGAIEMIIGNELMKNKMDGKEQLAYESFAKAIKSVTDKLIRVSGKKGIELLPQIKNGKGISKDGEVIDSIKEGVIEPSIIKEQALISAAETAITILRIDSAIKAKK